MKKLVSVAATAVLLLNLAQVFPARAQASSTVAASAAARPESKLPIYGEVALGYGKSLFYGSAKANLSRALGGTFGGGNGYNLATAFYVAPRNWRGLGVGSRLKGTFGTPLANNSGPDEYIFNYYAVSLSAKYYVSRRFNQGFYGRVSYGFGQFTAKRLRESTNSYAHQYGIGSSGLLGLGYTRRLASGLGLSLEAEYDRSARQGTVNQVGDTSFGTGQVGGNLVVSF